MATKAALGSTTATKKKGTVTVTSQKTPAKPVRKTMQIRLSSGDYITLYNTPTDVSITGGVPEWEQLERPGKTPIIRVASRTLREMSFSHQIIGGRNVAIGSRINKITKLVRKGQKVRLRNIDPTIESDIWWVVTGYDIKVLKRRTDQRVNAVELSWKFTEFVDEKATLKKITPKPKPKPKPKKPKKKSYRKYTVKKGDCLWKIAKKKLGNPLRWKEIYKLNKGKAGRRYGRVVRAKKKNEIANPHWIFPGQVFKLPPK